MTARSDRARVQTLLNEGRITAAEADLLFAALDDEGEDGESPSTSEDDEPEGTRFTVPRVTPEQTRDEARARAHEAAEQARAKARAARANAQNREATTTDMNIETFSSGTGGPGSAQSYSATQGQPPAPETPRLPQPPTPPTAPLQTGDSVHTYPAGRRWAKISGFCGDLDIRSDPNIREPSINGSASFEWDGNAFVIRTPPKDKEGGRGWLQRLHRAAGDLKVRLPEGMGLDLAIAAGDGSVRGVQNVRGNFTGGDFDLKGAETIDLTVTAGDISIGLKPTAGQQRLRATSGDIDLTLHAGSSVTVSGNATCGDLDLPSSFRREGGIATQRFSGIVGGGDAELELRLTAGDVNVKLERE